MGTEAKITVTMRPSEFDLLRRALAAYKSTQTERSHAASEARDRRAFAAEATLTGDLLVKLGS